MSEDDDAPVGYGKPPRQHRIKGHEVRNPWGRKGKPRPKINFLDAPFKLKIEGKAVTVTRGEALNHVLFREGIGGNVSAIKLLVERHRARALDGKASTNDDCLTPEDERAFQRCLERARDDKSAGNGASDPSPSQRDDAGEPR